MSETTKERFEFEIVYLHRDEVCEYCGRRGRHRCVARPIVATPAPETQTGSARVSEKVKCEEYCQRPSVCAPGTGCHAYDEFGNRAAPAPSGSVEGERDNSREDQLRRMIVNEVVSAAMRLGATIAEERDESVVRMDRDLLEDRKRQLLAAVRAAPHREGGSGEVTEAARLVLAERERQKAVEGWSTAHDDDHTDGSLAQAASCYAMPPEARSLFDEHEKPGLWPESWALKWWKPTPDNRVRELVKAGALILAEIERLQREARLNADAAALSRGREG